VAQEAPEEASSVYVETKVGVWVGENSPLQR